MTDKTELHNELESREMVSVGNWHLVTISVEEWSQYNSTVPTEKTVEKTTDFDQNGRGCFSVTFRHNDQKTYLKIKRIYNGNYSSVVYMGRPDSESVGPGWTCGVDCRNVDVTTAVEWAENYMVENNDTIHLYDE